MKHIATAIMISLATGGCLLQDESAPPATSEIEEPLYIAAARIWNPATIPVCWEGGGTAQERAWVMSAVRGSWEAVSGLRFVGWGGCASVSLGLHVRLQDDYGATLGLGNSLNGVANGVNLNTWVNATNKQVDCPNFNREDCVRSTAVHEFGHALGFLHEQDRPDRPSSCNIPRGPIVGDTTVGTFDFDSVMNYCNPVRNGRGLLSLNDIAGVRRFYGGPLGAPVTGQVDIPGGRAMYFAGGGCAGASGPSGSGSAIYYTDLNGIGRHTVEGCIYTQYVNSLGGPTGLLGFPTTDQQTIPGGWVSYFQGNGCTSGERGPSNSGSAIYANSAANVHAVRGCIYTKYWRDEGAATGHLGFPSSEEQTIPGGWVSYFQGNGCTSGERGPFNSGAAIYASGVGNVRTVQGCIYTKYWRDEGAATGHLGFPTSDEQVIPGGWVSYFQGNGCTSGERGPSNSGSAIYASGATGVHTVQGCIYTKYWRDHGGSSGILGFPVTDEQQVAGGWASYFKGAFCGPQAGPGGSGSGIFASGATGVHSVKGCIFTAYVRDHGGPAGHLGFPTSDELAITSGAVSYFAGNACGSWRGPFNSGSAIYAGPGGIHNVQGCIYKRYVELGGPFPSGLGYPTSNEMAVPGGWRSNFEHGYIFADGSTVQVIYQ